ncbi:LLM class flavin-dependent oxidoreductase [Plantactinospora sp. KLBMP9567]|uniref:LLM class flavin-dependent oxidoreductase n=1 Tax=Plantactinospora sp. KLBMP9567 TaxID=3085900 RepID=UPI002981F192|nr:LLM class flavin-dependent oxidoreductase [Plantactinospora sp. KLBMP9567]MDW5324843.1 LLM class flavin-dependent oxidoreductase [Plantactinospora sp. KLBMP9567]
MPPPPYGDDGSHPWTFAISPRNHDPDRAWPEIDATVRLADAHGFTGVLAHTGNDTLVDPWLVGQHALAVSDRLRPLVAVNPVYHHPFAVAQLAASLTYRYGRRLFLNFVAGTSTPDRLALGDETEHDRRYARLAEYGRIVLDLLGSPTPVTADGEFYRMRGARLRLPGPPELRPIGFVAGQSPAAETCAEALRAVRIRMFGPEEPKPGHLLGAYAALIVRETDEEAWRVALRRYPPDTELEAAGSAALRYTDAVWRRQAFQQVGGAPSWFWTAPMRSMRADCPFLVGGVETLAPVLAGQLAAGTVAFVLDLAPEEPDFAWAARLTRRAGELANGAG